MCLINAGNVYNKNASNNHVLFAICARGIAYLVPTIAFRFGNAIHNRIVTISNNAASPINTNEMIRH